MARNEIVMEPKKELVDQFKSFIDGINAYTNPLEGVAKAREALELARSANWELGIAAAHHKLAVCYAHTMNFELAVEHYEAAIPVLEKLDLNESLIAKNNFANLITKADPVRALPIHTEVYERAQSISGMEKTTLSALIGIGNDHDHIGNNDRFVECNQRVLERATELNILEMIAVSSMNLAEAYLRRGAIDLDSGLTFCNKAIEIEITLGRRRNVALYKTTLSEIYRELGDLVRAETIAREALQEARAMGIDEVFALRVLGAVFAAQGKLDEAAEMFELAVQKSRFERKQNDSLNLADVLIKLDPEKAYNIISGILEELHGSTNFWLVAKAHREMSDCLVKLERPSEAITHLKDHYSWQAKISKEQAQRQLLAMKAEFEAKADFDRQRQEMENNRAHLERELTNSTLQLVAQTELLSELRNDLLKFIHKFPMPDGAAKELRERLKTLPCKAVDWEKFDTQFKSAHPEFSKKLLEKCPTLTPMELRICSLLRMNLRSAEIAKLLCLSERSVEGHRAHVRKKMSLPHSEDLMLNLAKM